MVLELEQKKTGHNDFSSILTIAFCVSDKEFFISFEFYSFNFFFFLFDCISKLRGNPSKCLKYKRKNNSSAARNPEVKQLYIIAVNDDEFG